MAESPRFLHLSEKGIYLLELVCQEIKRSKSSGEFWVSHAMMLTGEAERYIEQGLNPPNWENWTTWGDGLSLSTWDRFCLGERIKTPAFETFCSTVNQLSKYIEFTPERVRAEDPLPYWPHIEQEISTIDKLVRRFFKVENPPLWVLSLTIGSVALDTMKRQTKYSMGDKDNIKSTPFKITIDDIYCGASKNDDNVHIFPIYALVSNGKSQLEVKWCTAYVSHGWCELLLDIRPYLWLGNEVIFNGQRYRGFTIEKTFTEIALDCLESQNEKEFPGTKLINFGGSFTPVTYQKFRRYFRYYRQLYPDKTEQEIALLSLKETPFARARISRGITEFNVYILSREPDGTPDDFCVIRACRPGDQ